MVEHHWHHVCVGRREKERARTHAHTQTQALFSFNVLRWHYMSTAASEIDNNQNTTLSALNLAPTGATP